MKNLPTIAGVIGIALIIASPLTAQAPSGSSTTPAGSSPSTSPSASPSESAAASAGTSTTAPDPSAPMTATAGSTAQAPATVARPAVPTTSPVAPVTATAPTSTVTPAADVRATTQDPRTSLTQPSTRNTTAVPGGVTDTANSDASRRDGGTGRRILGPSADMGSTSGVPSSTTTAATSESLATVPPVGVSSTATVAYLRAVEPAQRTAALDRVEAQLADTNRAINRLPNSAPSAPAAAQVDYAAAIQEVQAREMQLRSSLTTAQQADEAGWAEARNRLAADYDAYIAATHRARAAAVNLDPTVAPAE